MPATIFKSRENWLAHRSCTIGASEISSVLGANPYQSSLALYSRKRRALDGEEVEAVQETRKMLAGRLLERGIAELWAANTGRELIEPAAMAAEAGLALPALMPGEEIAGVVFSLNPSHPCSAPLSATPDYFAYDEGEPLPVLVEIKNMTPEIRMDSDGRVLERVPGPSWKQGPPLMYVMQVIQQMGILRDNGIEIARAFLVGYMGGDEYVEHEIAWDEDLWLLATQSASVWWDSHVKARVPPAIDKHTTSDQVYAAYRKATLGVEREVDPQLVMKYRDAKERAKVAENEVDLLKAELQAALADAETGTVAGLPVVTWKNQTQNRPPQPAKTLTLRVLRITKQGEGL